MVRFCLSANEGADPLGIGVSFDPLFVVSEDRSFSISEVDETRIANLNPAEHRVEATICRTTSAQ